MKSQKLSNLSNMAENILTALNRLNHFSHANQNHAFAKCVDPDELLIMSHLIRIYTICHSVLFVCLRSLFGTMVLTISKIEESTSETEG